MKLNLVPIRRLGQVLSIFSTALILFLFSALLAAGVYASAEQCEERLASVNFHLTTAFTSKEMLALSPSPGSLENRFPGLVSHLIGFRRKIIGADERFLETNDRTRLAADLKSVAVDFGTFRGESGKNMPEYALDHLEKRLQALQSAVPAGKMPFIEGELRQIESQIWELAVACLVGGEKIFLNKKLSELYPAEFKGLTRAQKQLRDREIDIAILRADGSWAWIEVKDWSLKNQRLLPSKEQLFRQSVKQAEVRKTFPHLKIRLVLFIKYALSDKEEAEYREKSKFDELVYLTPETGVEQMLELDIAPRHLWRLEAKREGRIPN